MSEPVSTASTPRRRPMSMYATPSPARGLKRLSLVAAREAEDVPSSGGRGLRELALAGSVGSEVGKRGSGSIASIPSWATATSASDRRSSVVSTSSATSLPSMPPSASSDASSGCPDSPSPSPSSPSPKDSRTTPTRETFSPAPRRHPGARSSISYSPSTSKHTQQSRSQSHATHAQYTTRARTGSTSSTATATSSERDRYSAEIRDRPRYSGDGERVEVLTLAEKHADLLRMIAMRERRVNELRQELATQEQALAALRARWTSVARADSGQTSGPGNALAHAVRTARESVVAAGVVAASAGGASASTSASGTTKSSVNGAGGCVGRGTRGGAGAEVNAGTTANGTGEETSAGASHASSPPPFALAVLDEHRSGDTPSHSSQDDEGGLQALLSTLAADADETIQEGKRFWGQLLRTVGAAAGGTVPEDRQGRDIVRNSIPGVSSLLPTEGRDKDATKGPAPPRNIRIQRPSLSPNAVRRAPTRPLSGMSSQPASVGRSASGSSTSASTLAASRSRSPQLDFLSDDGDDDHVVTQVLMPVKRMSLHLESGERKHTGAEEAPPSPGSVRSRGSPQPPITAVLDAVGW